jgi:hypothetical protein
METIKRKLKMLASIAPDRGFEARTRFAIVSTPARRSVFSLPSFQPTWIRGLGLGVAGLLIAAVPLLASYRSPSLSSLKDADKLSKEAAELPISIELEEVNYRNNTNEVITAAITEIRDTNVSHLKEGPIQSEIDDIQKAGTANDEIDRLLENVTL